jgi:arginyl-tRNA synthetase
MRQVSVDDMRSIYQRLGVDYELWHGESTVADRLPGVLDRFAEQGLSRESDGALIVDVAEEGDKAEIPPLMLLNSRGGATYHLTDVATIEQRVDELDADEIVYCVDLRQSQHFEQVFRAARKAGIADESLVLFFAGNGTVNGPDGKPFKTRDGGLPRLGDLLDEIQQLAATRLIENDLATDFPDDEKTELARKLGLAALTFGELSNYRGSGYNFDIDKFTLLQGKTGPYLQYVAVRMGSILARLADDGVAGDGILRAPQVDAERTLMLELLRWPEVIERAIETYSPTVIAEYTYDLAGTFNRFYEACHIRSESDLERQGSLIELVTITKALLEQALELLLIEVPARM